MEKLEVPNWHLKFGPGASIAKVPNWHLKFRPRRSAQPSLCFHRARRHYGGECSEQPTSGADEYDVRGRRWMDCIVRLGNGRAIGRARVNVFVVRAFLKMRALLGDKRELAQKLASLEKELKKRLDVHEAVIVTILQRVMDIIDPPLTPEPPKPRIGFSP
jgi:hypothetical protein